MGSKQNTITISEIFTSIQGEGTDVGLPTTFVRLFGCNLKEDTFKGALKGTLKGCSYCDTPQDPKDKKKYTVKDLVNEIIHLGITRVCFTGGEPMLQWENLSMVVFELTNLFFDISIETNGCVLFDPDNYKRSYKFVMDVKCPSSRVSHKNVLNNLLSLQSHDEVKFVISDERDYRYMQEVLLNYKTPAKILISPCFGENIDYSTTGKTIVNWLLRDRLYNARLSLQLHKVIGVK